MAIFSSQAEEKKQDIKMDVDIVNESVIGDPVKASAGLCQYTGKCDQIHASRRQYICGSNRKRGSYSGDRIL